MTVVFLKKIWRFCSGPLTVLTLSKIYTIVLRAPKSFFQKRMDGFSLDPKVKMGLFRTLDSFFSYKFGWFSSGPMKVSSVKYWWFCLGPVKDFCTKYSEFFFISGPWQFPSQKVWWLCSVPMKVFFCKIFDGFVQDPRLVGSAGLCWGSGNSYCKETRLYRGKHFCRLCNANRAVFVNLLRSPEIDSQPGGIDFWAP